MLNPQDKTIDGVRCAVHDSGPKERSEAVVFVHGNPGPMDDWETLVPPVEKFARVVAMDMPGYGRAERPRDFEYTVDGYGRYLEHLLDALGIRRAHLVLHDFGGAWGLRWAADHLDAVASLTLINTGVLVGYEWHKYARVWQTPIIGELFQLSANRPMLRLSLNADNPKPMPRSFVDRIARYADWGHKRAVLKLYRACRNIDASFRPLAERVRALGCPVCVVWGAGDIFLPMNIARQQKGFFPQAEEHFLEGLGHWPFIDDPEAVQGLVVPFLQAHVRG